MGWWAAAAQVARDALGLPRPLALELPEPAATFDTVPRPIDRVISEMLNVSGTRVTREDALTVAAVQRGRNEMCSVATLPLRLYKGIDVKPSTFLRQINPNVANIVTLAATIEDLVFEGLSWWLITGADVDGYPLAAEHVALGRVSVDPPKGKTAPYGVTVPGVWIDGEWIAITRMIRFDSPNPGLLRANGRSIRRAILLDKLAAMYAANPRAAEVFRPNPDSDEAPMEDDDVAPFLADWTTARRTSTAAWLPGNVIREDVAQPSPAEMQLVELQKQVTLEIANGIGVDPEDLGVSTTSRTYFNAIDRRISKINDSRKPIMEAITQRLSMGDVTRHGQEVRFDLTDYLRADPITQVQYWEGLTRMGATDAAEVRTMAGLSGPPPDRATPAPALPAAPAESAAAPHAFSAAGATFTLTAPATTFSTDTEGRTITGTAVPYGVIGRKYGIGYRFLPGSLEWSDVSRVKHLKEHYTPVGKATAIESTKDGLTVTLSVAGGPDGSPDRLMRDQLLSDAADGLYDGLSIGVDFDLNPESGDVEYVADENVYDVKRATLREVSTTAMPVFDDARVTGVKAHRSGDALMFCPHCGKQHDAGMACATFAAHLANLAASHPTPPPVPSPAPIETPPAPETFGRPVVNPLGGGAAQVTEPLPYRFDRHGELRSGTHDFSADLLAGWRPGGGGDPAARDRANGFLEQAFAVTPANVAALNPNRQRPDMYVDQMEYEYPLWEAINKGTLDDVTPFVVPKFSSASGLVADHVSGTEPTPGAFAATTQTITPTPVSGKVEVLREAIDQGGNPQMSGLLWRQMTRGYFEALEAYAVAQLVAVAASLPDITITTAAVDAALDAALTNAIVPLQYIRGGNKLRRVYTQVDLYKAMATAKDTAGRRLYPLIGPQNASGTAEGQYSAIDAHGMRWLPAWALAATGTVAASSYAFDPANVCGWASAPRKIDIEWRVAWADIGIWGYKAFAVTDFAATREIIYDPI